MDQTKRGCQAMETNATIYGANLDRINSSKNFYQLYTSTKLYIESIEKVIESLENELKILINKSGPANVRAVTYDSIPGVAIKLPDEKVLERILQLRTAIDINKTNLRDWNDTFEQLKKSIIKKSKHLDDLNLKVFVAAWLEGKKNEEIAQELGYSLTHIWHSKVEINKLLVSTS